MHIRGCGAVDGSKHDLSSTRGEHQGQTAMAIVSKLLLQTHENTSIPATLMGDNQGVQQQWATPPTNRLKHHRSPNIDLRI
jgi:hypothetical protein